MRNVSNRHFDELENFGNIPAVNNQDVMNLLTEMNKKIDQINTKIGDLSKEMKARCVSKTDRCGAVLNSTAIPTTWLASQTRAFVNQSD